MQQHETHSSPYLLLAVMAALSFAAMYVLMYAMVDRFANVYANINQVYMAGLMTAPMVVFELLLMKRMYSNKSLNAAIFSVSILVAILMWMGIRHQTGVADSQFLRSMIPHHAGAILMCQQASIADQNIKQLCKTIIEGQQQEIDRMHALLLAK